MATFCSCPENFPESKLKNLSLAEEISSQNNIDSAVWLLGITLVKVYNAKEQVSQKEIQNVQFKEKKNARKCNVEATAWAEKDKERSDQKWNKGRGALIARSTPHQLNLQFVKRKCLKNFLHLKGNYKENLGKCNSRRGQVPYQLDSQPCQHCPYSSSYRALTSVGLRDCAMFLCSQGKLPRPGLWQKNLCIQALRAQ